MKFFKYLLLVALLHGYPSCSMGQTVDKTIEANYALGLHAETNLIKNPSAGKNRRYSVAVGITLTRDTSAGNKIDNKASWSIDSTAINNYQEFELIPTPDDLTSGNCGFSGIFKGDGSLYKAQILDGSSNVLAQTVTLTNETGWREFKVWHPCGASGARKVRITQTEAGTAPAINVGKLFYGRMEPGSGVPPNTFTASSTGSGVVSLETPTGTDWISGNCVLSDTSLFTCSFNSGVFTSTPNCNATLRGTPSTASSSASVFTDSLAVRVRTWSGSSYSAQPFVVTCTKTGSDYIQPAITPDQTSTVFTAAIAPSSGSWTTTSGTAADFSAAGGVNIVNPVNSNAGTISVASGNLPGVTFTPKSTGVYLACTSLSVSNSTAGAQNFAELTMVGATGGGQLSQSQNAANYSSQMSACHTFVVNSIAPVTLKIRGATSTGTITLTAAGSAALFFSVAQITPNINTPLLLNTVYADTAVKAEKSAGLTSVDYGTYSATVTNSSNATPITSPISCTYIRIGSTVSVSCPTAEGCSSAGGTLTAINVTLPIATTQGSTISGVIGTLISGEVGRVQNNGSNLGQMIWSCNQTGSTTRTMNFQYQVP